jgi:class 3 adenylate cyclase
MEENNNDIEKILAEREKLDGILKSEFTKKVSIMFTDIKGSTSFYESRGDIDGRMMIHRHNEIVLPIIKDNNCVMMERIGDGTMTVFDDPVNAVKSSLQIQRSLQDFNSKRTSHEQIQVRIGLNHGTVITDKSGIYGDAVNVASRVESLANANEIFLTEDMYRAVKEHDEFMFRYVDTVEVKGKKEAIKVYRLICHEEELQMGKTRMPPQKKEGAFVLEVTKSGQKLKVSGFERREGEEKPVKSYKETNFNDSKIKEYTSGIINLLNRSNKRGKISSDLLIKLKDYGRLLFDELIPINIKDKLIATTNKNLLISTDDKLVYIPWELLYDGKDFLCQRFSIGRSVSTQQQVSVVVRALGRPLKMQLLTDPGGDLKASYEEGVAIKNGIGMHDDLINVSLKSTDIRTDYVKSKIRNFDIVHYAGHAEHNAETPGMSGWILRDGKLSAEEIISLTGPMPMPSLVFSNACQTGQTEEWQLEEDCGDRIFGLANAFLLSGVQHYIGTFWEIPDEAGSFFAINFYKNIAQGVTIGEAMRLARMALINKYGEDTIVWASYMLYGDPTTSYIHHDMEVREQEQVKKPARKELVSAELRHKEEVVHLGEKKRTPNNLLYAGIALLIIAVLGAFVFKWKSTDRPATLVVKNSAVPTKDNEETRKRIDKLVVSLAGKYRAGNFEQKTAMQDEWTSRPLTMVLMDVTSVGGSDSVGRDKLMSLLPLSLQGESQVHMVEREILDKLLAELQLSSSDLADPMTSLKLGKVLSAKIILTGRIIGDKNGHTVILRGIDTETTAVKKVISAESTSKEIDRAIIDDIGKKITDWVSADFPLRGRILSLSGDKCSINLGNMHGLKKGDIMEVLNDPQKGAGNHIVTGEAVITEAGKYESWASVSGNTDMMKQGDRVREKRGDS